jgi:uncharacterized RDD family membrane protein YckC
MHINTRPAAALLRRIAAIVYDSLLLLAVLFVAALPFVITIGDSRQSVPVHRLFQIYLLAVNFIFFAWFWIHGGQTLGMRAWCLQVVREDGGKFGWRDAALRFFSAMLSWLCLGLGFLWILIDKEKLAWHDRLSRTRVILLSKPETKRDKGH